MYPVKRRPITISIYACPGSISSRPYNHKNNYYIRRWVVSESSHTYRIYKNKNKGENEIKYQN